MALVPYTSTYTDIDTNIFDADDLLNEFNRVAEFINTWALSIESIGTVETYDEVVTITKDIVNGYPSNGTLQKLLVASDAEEFTIDFQPRGDGDPYRILMTIRCQNKDTRFRVSGPAGTTHVFGVNKSLFSPSQVIGSGYYTALVVATYGTTGLFINVFADNTEASTVESNDILTAAQI